MRTHRRPSLALLASSVVLLAVAGCGPQKKAASQQAASGEGEAAGAQAGAGEAASTGGGEEKPETPDNAAAWEG